MKPSKKRLPSLIALLLLITFPAETLAWGEVGHHLVVRLAIRRLETTAPSVRGQINGILNGEKLLRATMWPDGARFVAPYLETYNNHFVDIPFSRINYIDSKDCEFVQGDRAGDCVIHALDRYSAVLLAPGQSPKARRDALAFILHFVGDMHQPMHAIKRDDDKGGNSRKLCVLIDSAEECYDDEDQREKKNLHAAWDKYIIEFTGLSENEYFDELSQRLDAMSPSQIAAIEQGTTVKWAEDAHNIARLNAYNIGNKRPDGFYHITSGYYTENLPRVNQQLLFAGIRLALVLREIFIDRHAHPSLNAQPPNIMASPEPVPQPRARRRRRRARNRGQ